MANIKIPALTELASGLATGDKLVVEDVSAGQTKHMNADRLQDLFALLSGATFTGTVNLSSGQLQVAGDRVAEYGSDPTNGEYVRFYDGTQICWDRKTLAYLTSSIVRVDWTFPAVFSSFPKVAYVPNADVLTNMDAAKRGGSFPYATNNATTSVRLVISSNGLYTGGDEEFGGEAIAVGKWK